MNTGGGVSPGTYAGSSGSGISVHRSAAHVTAGAGIYSTVTFDTVNDCVPQVNATLAGGIITITSGGIYVVSGCVHVTQLLLMTGGGVQVLRDGLVVHQKEATGLALALGGLLPVDFNLILRVDAGGTIEVRAASIGVGGAALLTGRTRAFLTVASC